MADSPGVTSGPDDHRDLGRAEAPPSSELLHRLLIDRVVDYAIFALDAHGRVATWNPGAERLKGYAADEIIGRHFSIFYPRQRVAEGFPQYELAEAARNGSFEDEGWRVRKDGSQFWANVVITALRDDAGTLVGFAKVTRDLTARREAETRRRELAAAEAARVAAEGRADELEALTRQLEEQALELEAQTEEAQSLAEELEQSNEALQSALADAEEARDAASTAERFSRGILESIVDPFVVQDADWRFVYVNEAAAAVFAAFGYRTPRELRGHVVWEAFPHLRGSAYEREMRRAMETRSPVTFEVFNPERGSWSQMFCYPLPDGGLATQWKDVTARKQAEEAAHYLSRASDVLGHSLDYQTTLSELAQLVVPQLADWCAVDVITGDGRIERLAVAHVDPERVAYAKELGRRYPPDPNASTGVPKVIRTGEPELISDISDDVLARATADEERVRVARALGLRSAMVVPLEARGRVLGAITLVAAESRRRYGDAELALAVELGRRAGTAVDNARLMDEARAARDAAEQANRAKSEFLATMSHELRTPLNAIGGYAELISLGIYGPATNDQRDALDRIQQSKRHLQALIEDVLSFARIEAGRLTFAIDDVPVAALVAELEPLVAPQLRSKQLVFEHAAIDPALIVRADAEKVRQILLNLLSNAIKFTPAAGQITLRAAPRGAEVELVLSDTGPGIPSDKLQAIFDPFVQLGRSLTKSQEGAGLGLAISRDLARAMGGDLQAQIDEGAGATFVLTLPGSGSEGRSAR